ncbi:aminotransferase class I/II-fold pyridoxal phosphate-dependent enzyme [Actinocorallia longicatena]|uniref:FMN hydroxy acid dehydrogenase domain-containing protein n=1 Tax=Actinocorallia longicatena TaxID=111803 RepID=A0ABP6QP34_9ACTN
MESARTVADYATLARKRLDGRVWDLLQGDEATTATNLEAFERLRLRPSVLAGVESPQTEVKILGRTWTAPVCLAPPAVPDGVHPEPEMSAAAGAAAVGTLPLVVSSPAGRTAEEIVERSGGTPLWLRLSLLRDREAVRELMGRAEDAGYEALVLAADDPALDWSAVERLCSVSPLPLLLMGVMSPDDAVLAAESGMDGIIVSNQVGRRLGGVAAGVEALPGIAAALAGRTPVLLDGGIRRGRDVLAALALGADAVLLGRPVLHGLAAEGAAGVRGVLSLLLDDLRETMALAGVGAVTEAAPALVGAAPAAVREITPAVRGGGLTRADLHASVADPVLDTMNFLNEITLRHPDAISFAPGRPYDGFFDTEQIFGYIRGYLDHVAARGATPAQVREEVFQYGPAAGRIRELIAHSLWADEQIEVAPGSIVVTVGCQEAMFLALRALFTGPSDVLMVSSPCYVGITGAARLLDIGLTAVEEHTDGLSVEALEAAILAERARGRRPKALYVVPDHSNPSGATMPLRTRFELLDLADRYDFLILEDSPYRLLGPGTRVPTLKSLDRAHRVVMFGSYSKTIFPGARLGFAVADQEVATPGGTVLLADELAKIKSMITVNTSPLSQAAVAGALLASEGRISDLNREAAAYYGDATRHTLHCLELTFPADVRADLGLSWSTPEGGFFLTLTVPFPADDAALSRSAREHQVIWTPMSYFHPGGGGTHMIRLSTSYLTHQEIETGITRLAAFITSELAPR